MSSKRVEAKMTLNDNGIYDFSIDPATGDLTNEDSYDTDILCSLFTDKRADSSQIAESSKRRGWFGDTVASLENYEIGSWIWLLSQERLINDTVNKAVSYCNDALQWIIDLGLATRIDVTGEKSGTKDIKVTIKIYIENNLVSKYNVLIWENSIYKL
jgi:phage gp46-like protein